MCSTSSIIVLSIQRGLVACGFFGLSSKNHDLCFSHINGQLVSFQPSRNTTNFIVEVNDENKISVLVKKNLVSSAKNKTFRRNLLSKTSCQTRAYFQLGTLRYDYVKFFPNFSKKQEVLNLICNFKSRMGCLYLIQGPLLAILSLDGKIPELKDKLKYPAMVHR